MNKLNLSKIVLILFVLVCFSNCSTENVNQDINIEKSNISVKLTNTLGNYDKVFVEVLDVHVLTIDDKTVSNCWLSLNAINTGIYNLPDLTDGDEALLVDDLQIPSGTIYEIKLVLGDNNSIVIDGNMFPLSMPSVHQQGLVIRNVNFLESDVNYELILEFDVDQSILRTDTPDYIILKPVIRSKLKALTESI